MENNLIMIYSNAYKIVPKHVNVYKFLCNLILFFIQRNISLYGSLWNTVYSTIMTQSQ